MAKDSKKNIVILGGAYSGLSTAHYLLKHAVPQLPNPSSYQVVVISTATHAFHRPACPRAIISDSLFDQDKLFVSTPELFEQYPKENFRFIVGKATNLDTENRTVSIAATREGSNDAKKFPDKLTYHALVIATGTSTPSPLMSINTDVQSLKDSWSTFRQALPEAKHIVIAGGGAAGIETAGELGEYLNGRNAGWFGASKMTNPKVRITVVNAGDRILPVLRSALAARAEQYLAEVGVTVINETRVQKVTPEGAGTDNTGPHGANLLTSQTLVALDNGESLEADIYIPAIGTRPNTSFVPSALLTPDGRVNTNAKSLRVDAAGPRVYALGDVASYARSSIPLILDAVPSLCANIKRDLLLEAGDAEAAAAAGAKEDREFKEDTRETQLVPMGSKAVGSAMGYQLPSFMVWLIKGRDYAMWTSVPVWSGKQWAKEK